MVGKSGLKKVKSGKVNNLCKDNSCDCNCGSYGAGGAIYGLGFIGAVIYYISIATSFWAGVLGVLKSVVWPVFLVFGLLKFIGA